MLFLQPFLDYVARVEKGSAFFTSSTLSLPLINQRSNYQISVHVFLRQSLQIFQLSYRIVEEPWKC